MRTDGKTNLHTIIDKDLNLFISNQAQMTGRQKSTILNELLRKAAEPLMKKTNFKYITKKSK
jgi:hypothetical protein